MHSGTSGGPILRGEGRSIICGQAGAVATAMEAIVDCAKKKKQEWQWEEESSADAWSL
jgi:hypothetical protein